MCHVDEVYSDPGTEGHVNSVYPDSCICERSAPSYRDPGAFRTECILIRDIWINTNKGVCGHEFVEKCAHIIIVL